MNLQARLGSRRRSAAAVSVAGALSLAVLAGTAEEPATAHTPEQRLPTFSPTPGWVPELSTERTNVYLQEDGSYRAEAFAARVNFVNGQGDLAPIDNELIDAAGDIYAVRNTANDYTLELPEDAGDSPVRIAAGDHWATFEMVGLDGAPVVNGAEATYTDTGPVASEVIYEARPDGVKESIVLPGPPAQDIQFIFNLELSDGLTPILRGDIGVVDILTASGKTAFTMPAPFMTDSADALSTNVEYDLHQEQSGGWQLRVRPGLGWLQSPDRVYPVVVDPTITEPNSIYDGWISEGNPKTVNTGGNHLRIGGLSGNRQRSLLQFTLGQIPVNATVTAASLQLYLDATQTSGAGSMDVAARRVVDDQPWDRDYLTWNRRREYAAWSTAGGVWSGDDPPTSLGGTTSGYKALDATLTVQRWINDSWVNNGFLVKAISDVDKRLWFHSNNSVDGKKPKLVVTYTVPPNSPPSPPTVALSPDSCLGPCDADWLWTASLTPTLTATATDADTSTLATTFEIRSADTGTTVTASPSMSGAQGSSQTWTVPAGTLADLGAYEVRASVSDGSTTRWSAWKLLSVDVDVLPAAPTGLSLSPCADPCAPLVSTSLRPTLIAQVADADSQFLRVTIELRTASSTAIIATSGEQLATSGQPVEWIVPAGTLVDGGQYKFRAKVKDETSTRTGAWTDFTTTLPTTGPLEPINFSVSPCAAPCTPWTPTSVTPTFTAIRPLSLPALAHLTFELRSPSGEVLEGTVSNVAPGATARWQVPVAQLGGGASYEARVGATWGGVANWTGWRTLTIVTDADVGVGEPALDTNNVSADDPIDPTNQGVTEVTEDESTSTSTYTESQLDALDAAADAEYKELSAEGVVDPDAELNRTVPIQVKYAPILFVHPDEEYGPMSARTTMKHADLDWSHEHCRDDTDENTIDPDKLGSGGHEHSENGSWCNGHTGANWRSNQYVGPRKRGGPSGNEGYYINLNNSWRKSGVNNGPDGEPVYWIYDTSGSYAKLSYYFHYGWSRPHTLGAPGHEGDWEHIEIQFYRNTSGQIVPWYVIYYYHNDRCYLYWDDVPKKNGKHPRVAVALEAHGSYPVGANPPSYYANYYDDTIAGLDDGTKWWAVANLDKATAQDWHGYGGIWGQNGSKEYTSGPLGPGPARDYHMVANPPGWDGKCDMY